jgi:hypothetical protein
VRGREGGGGEERRGKEQAGHGEGGARRCTAPGTTVPRARPMSPRAGSSNGAGGAWSRRGKEMHGPRNSGAARINQGSPPAVPPAWGFLSVNRDASDWYFLQ